MIYLILDNIRSVHNVGSIFRTAECAGVSKIYCVGTTPVPFDRFGRKRKDFAKVSLGAEEMLEWEHISDEGTIETIKQLKKDQFEIVAVEQTKDSVELGKFKSQMRSGEKIAYILGNEVDGVSAKLLKLADMAVEIPMKGRKESLNVSVTAGIVLFATHS